jgi:hypothetical protein
MVNEYLHYINNKNHDTKWIDRDPEWYNYNIFEYDIEKKYSIQIDYEIEKNSKSNAKFGKNQHVIFKENVKITCYEDDYNTRYALNKKLFDIVKTDLKNMHNYYTDISDRSYKTQESILSEVDNDSSFAGIISYETKDTSVHYTFIVKKITILEDYYDIC